MAQELKKNLPQDPHASDLLGWIYYQKGVYRPALDQLQPAAEALPDDAVIQYHLGMTYSQIGEAQKARQALRQALKHGLAPPSLASEAEQKLKQLSREEVSLFPDGRYFSRHPRVDLLPEGSVRPRVAAPQTAAQECLSPFSGGV